MIILFIMKKSKDTIFNTYRVVENNGFVSNEKKMICQELEYQKLPQHKDIIIPSS